jgi:phosphatidylglycerol:prolipoprotein diacylglycerol transferase
MTNAEIFWVLGLVIGVLVAVASAAGQHLDPRRAYLAAVAALLGGLLGGILLGFHDYGFPESPNPLIWGKSFCGGLVGGAAGAVLFLRWQRLPVLAYGDTLVTGLAFGYAVGRIGCFCNGCDYGRLSSVGWAITYPPGTEAYAGHLQKGWIAAGAAHSLPVHPVQLYAAAAGLLIGVVLSRIPLSVPGRRVFSFFCLYGLYRFEIENLRGDFSPWAGPLSLPQAVALVLLAVGATGLLRRPRAENGTTHTNPPTGFESVARGS